MKPALTTQVLGVDLLAPEHAPALQILASHPAIAATTRVPHPYPAGAALQFVEKQLQDRREGHAYAFVIQDRNVVVGACGIHGIANGEAQELGFWVGHDYWGQGYATFGVKRLLEFAFRNLGLNRVGAAALESNAASRRVLTKTGFELLGIGPHTDPLLKRPDEPIATYSLTRTRWREFNDAPALARLHPALQAILRAEIAAGNEVNETGGGWPDPDSVFIKLRDRFLTHPDPLPPGVVYTEPNDPHWWFADYSSVSPRHILAC